MPIVSTVEGNLIALAQEGKYRAIIQGCNCWCTMGSGLAPQIAKAWPQAEVADNQTEKGDRTKLGDCSYHRDSDLDMFIFNMYTQFGFGEKPYSVNYEAIRDGFYGINVMFKRLDQFDGAESRPIGIPMIGAGLAGGHWEAIKTIIDLVTPDVDIELVVYKP